MNLKTLIITRLADLQIKPVEVIRRIQDSPYSLTAARLSQLMKDDDLERPPHRGTIMGLAHALIVDPQVVAEAVLHSIGVLPEGFTFCDCVTPDGESLMVKIRNDRTQAQRAVLRQVAQDAVLQSQEIQDQMALLDGQSEA